MSTWRSLRPSPAEAEPVRVSEAIDRAAAVLGVRDAGAAGRVLTHWEEIVGPAIASHAKPRTLRDGVLGIAADQPTWAAQLRYMGPDIASRINATLGRDLVREVTVSVSSQRRSRPGPTGSQTPA